jgi:high-affinity nickel-transport protein
VTAVVVLVDILERRLLSDIWNRVPAEGLHHRIVSLESDEIHASQPAPGRAAMTGLAADGLGLTALVFLLGLRHGFDPDHLVAIDGLTRASPRQEMRRWNGVFFSLGHGAVVTLVGMAVALVASEWQAPAWLRDLGALISITVLLMLGIANLAMLFRTPSGSSVPLVGIRSRWFAEKLSGASHPVFIASIGAAFALSFDTISHTLVFSLTGATMAGWLFATLLGLVFTLGMMLTDALNGWWVARMVRAADERARRASRAMSIAIAALCLAIAAAGAVELDLPGPLMSGGTLAAILAAYLLACRCANGDGNSGHGPGKSGQAG